MVKVRWIGGGTLLLLALAMPHAETQDTSLSFFITSVGSGNGANLGGLGGADKHCQTLAAAAGQGNKTWHAYLSADAAAGQPAVNAKDRVGRGPWYNAKGVRVAENVAQLHSDNNKLSKANSLTEKGEVVNGRGDTPNRHDIMTGSGLDGSLVSAPPTATTGRAVVRGQRRSGASRSAGRRRQIRRRGTSRHASTGRRT